MTLVKDTGLLQQPASVPIPKFASVHADTLTNFGIGTLEHFPLALTHGTGPLPRPASQ